MKIQTARFGEIEINPADIITFNDGVIGFPNYKRFVFLPFMEGTDFELFQAVDHGNLAFVVLDPFLFSDDYSFEIDDAEQAELQAVSKDDLKIRVIVTIPEDPKMMTANMQGPVIVNQDRLLGRQIVLQNSGFDTKQKVFLD